MDYAIAFAETGHLCLATLHANSTNQALDRIINFFPEERRAQLLMDLSLNVRAFVAQRLIPRRDGRAGCGRRVMLNSPLISDLIFKATSPHQGDHEEVARARHADLRPVAVRPLRGGPDQLRDALRNADSLNDLRLEIKLHARRRRTATSSPAPATSTRADAQQSPADPGSSGASREAGPGSGMRPGRVAASATAHRGEPLD